MIQKNVGEMNKDNKWNKTESKQSKKTRFLLGKKDK